MSIPPAVASKASNVCWSCRVRKQGCDKHLPSCSRCALKLLRCDYSWIDSQAQVQRDQPPSPLTETSLLVPRCPDCLDLSSLGARELLQATSANPDPSYLAKLISDIFKAAGVTVASLVDEFSATIYRRLPVINQDALRLRLTPWPSTAEIGLTILVWAFYVVTRLPCADSDHSMHSLSYQTIKQMFMLRAAGGVTLELLQAGLLVAYYECGHGLPQEAHMTLATCAAIARLMGFDFTELNEQQDLDPERSACRWAIVLLDRTVALSAIECPVPLALPINLPADVDYTSLPDTHLDHHSFYISAKVALALGAAVSYANGPQPTRLGGSTYLEIYNHLETLVRDLIHAAKTGRDSYHFCQATSLAVSALFALHAVNPSRENTELYSRECLHLQTMIRMVRDTCQEATHMVCQKGASGIEGGRSSLSMVAICALARAAVVLLRLGGSGLVDEDLDMLRFNLRCFGTRWTIARAYLRDFDKVVQLSRPSGMDIGSPPAPLHPNGTIEQRLNMEAVQTTHLQ